MTESFTAVVHHRLAVLTVYGKYSGNDAVVEKIAISIPGETIDVHEVNHRHREVRELVELLIDYLDGKPVDFSTVTVDTGFTTGFRNAVTAALRNVPPGMTCSYAGLAAAAGFPRAIRAAASTVRHNPVPIIVPCHRVIRQDGTVGGYCGRRSGPYVELKKELLRMEKLSYENKMTQLR